MRVLMLGWEYPPDITGGLGTACRGLALALEASGVEVLFLAPRLSGVKGRLGGLELVDAREVEIDDRAPSATPAPAPPGEQRGIHRAYVIDSPLAPYQTAHAYASVVAQAVARLPASTAGRHRLNFLGGYGPTLFDEVQRYAGVAEAVAERETFDVIHAHDWMTFPAALAARRRSGKPVVAHVHALEVDRTGDEGADQRVVALEREGLRAADAIIAVSGRTARMIARECGVDPAKIVVVHNGACARAGEPSAPRPRASATPPRRPLVVFLGRLTRQKGPDYFLEVAHLVAGALPDAHFAMAGIGDMRPQLVERMATLDLQARFHFTGFVDEARRAELLDRADCFVMTSVSEPFGLTPVEALLHGVPVVVSRQSGVAEVLSGAIKVDFWDVRRTADAVVRVLSDPALAEQLRRDGAADVAKLGWDVAARGTRRVYEDLVRGGA